MLMEHTTIKEVANKAKVSVATVSRILSGKYRHKPETVEHVKRVIEELQISRSAPMPEIAVPDCIGITMFAYRDFLNDSYNSTLVTAIMETLWCNGHRRFGIVSMSRADLGQDLWVTSFMDTIRELSGGRARIWRQELHSLEDTVSGWVSEMQNRKEAPTAVFVTNSYICQKIYAELIQDR